MHLTKSIILSILFISFSTSSLFSQIGSNTKLFYAGMYKSGKIGILGNGCYYLKFFEDGTVLRTFSDQNQENEEQVEKRMTKINALMTNSKVTMTKYFRLGNIVTFTFGESPYQESYTAKVYERALTVTYKGSLVQREEKYTHWIKLKPLSEIRPQTISRPNNNSNSNLNSRPLTGLGLATPKVYAVIVGVAKYNHINSLNYTDDDAYKLYAYLKSPEGGALPDNQIEILIDEVATRANILQKMRNTFSKAGPNDLVLFYFSGHGEEGSFLPSDFNGYSNKLTHSSIRDIFDQSRAKHKLCIADACHAGSLDKGVKNAWAGVYDNYYNALRNSRGGLALFMSSKAEETSLEIGGLRQSIFTYYMLEGLKGKADVNRNKVITIQELFNYVKTNVKAYTGNRQSPVIHGNYDTNMPVGAVR